MNNLRRAPLIIWATTILEAVSADATDEQWSEWLRVPLEHAAARGNFDLFNSLLEAGANGKAGWRGIRGRTLLDAAALGGNMDVVSGLLRVGSKPDVNVVSCSSTRSALYTATVFGHEAVARRLVVAGADANFQDLVHRSPVLHEAARGGHGELVEMLLMGGAHLDARDQYGGTPLHVASDEGHTGLVSTLLLRGANKDALDNEGSTPVMGASVRGHASVVQTLLTAGADFSIRNTTGAYAALDLAAEEGHVPVLEVILGHGADVNARDNNGYTALHAAAEYDRSDAIGALIEAGADIELKSDDGSTPLLAAASPSRRKAMLALRQHGATIDVRNNKGDTPLHCACFRRCEGLDAAVELLLRWGNDETALNEQGQSSVDLLNDGPHVDEEDAIYCCSQDEIERVQQRFARAPADRAWHRRGWLVVLRARASKARAASHSDGGSAVTDSAAGGRSEGNGSSFNACGGAISSEGAGEFLDSMAAFLVELGLEGVFRTVAGFL